MRWPRVVLGASIMRERSRGRTGDLMAVGTDNELLTGEDLLEQNRQTLLESRGSLVHDQGGDELAGLTALQDELGVDRVDGDLRVLLDLNGLKSAAALNVADVHHLAADLLALLSALDQGVVEELLGLLGELLVALNTGDLVLGLELLLDLVGVHLHLGLVAAELDGETGLLSLRVGHVDGDLVLHGTKVVGQHEE